jgi:uncharacterized protein
MKITKSDRKNRGPDFDSITELLNRARVGRVATVSTDGTPYVVPVNFAFEGDRIYFHCALEGLKLDYIKANPKAGFEADDLIELYSSPERPCFCGSYYRSVIARGKAAIVNDQDKKKIRLMAARRQIRRQTLRGDAGRYCGPDLRCRDRCR